MAGTIGAETRQKIKYAILEAVRPKLKKLAETQKSACASGGGTSGITYSPFHQALFPKSLLFAWQFERACSTVLGKCLEKAAELIAVASGRYKTVKTQKRLEGTISNAARVTLDSIINSLRTQGFQGQRFDELAEKVASAYRGGNGSKIRIVVDLYLEGWQGNEEFYEMKSPLPNKDQCVATTEKLLAIHAVKHALSPRVTAKYAMAFNPFGESRSEYRHSIAQKYLDLETEVLIGAEFWDHLGGNGTYKDLLDIYAEAGREIRPDLGKVLGVESS